MTVRLPGSGLFWRTKLRRLRCEKGERRERPFRKFQCQREEMASSRVRHAMTGCLLSKTGEAFQAEKDPEGVARHPRRKKITEGRQVRPKGLSWAQVWSRNFLGNLEFALSLRKVDILLCWLEAEWRVGGQFEVESETVAGGNDQACPRKGQVETTWNSVLGLFLDMQM